MTDWEQLLISPPDRALDSLEHDVENAVIARSANDRRSATLLSAQAGLCALSIFGGLAWGGLAATHAAPAPPLGVFSPDMALAPSSRLATARS
jgi:hypothetical protein